MPRQQILREKICSYAQDHLTAVAKLEYSICIAEACGQQQLE